MQTTPSIEVPSRRFVDAEGRTWRVRQFTPSAPTTLLSPAHAGGWLTFEREDGERRRLVPAPASWYALTDAALARALQDARPVAKAETMREVFANQGWGELGGV
jgi:hypothetical protein